MVYQSLMRSSILAFQLTKSLQQHAPAANDASIYLLDLLGTLHVLCIRPDDELQMRQTVPPDTMLSSTGNPSMTAPNCRICSWWIAGMVYEPNMMGDGTQWADRRHYSCRRYSQQLPPPIVLFAGPLAPQRH